MTRAELLTKLASLKARRIVLTWSQFASSVADSDAGTKTAILTAANNEDGRALFSLIIDIVKQKKMSIATAEVESLAADDSLSITELLNLYE
jgi:hypothetical protein